MREEDLGCRQRQVVASVLARDSKTLVLGGPGTGKTTVALWTARVLTESPISPKPRILFLTFSRSAVSQIVRRSPGIIPLTDGNIEISTFHGLAYRLISAFGRYGGLGTARPSIQSEARVKLLGQDGTQLRYSDLLPRAIGLLQSEPIRRLLSSRWQLIICDEVQDTNQEQWEVLQLLNPPKLLLLGDANQMIYTFIPGVSPQRFATIRSTVDVEIELPAASYRDPTGAIPALAEAVRNRSFDDPAVLEALGNERLTVLIDTDGRVLIEVLTTDLTRRRRQEIGVFAHSNAAVADIADQLHGEGIEHVLIGIPEAHAEALRAIATQCAYSVGEATFEDVRVALAVFLTAMVRGRDAPQIAQALIGRMKLPGVITDALGQLKVALRSASEGTIAELAEVAARSWEGLRISAGVMAWRSASRHFRRLIYPIRNAKVSVDSIAQMRQIVEESRVEALVDLDYSERGKISLMNYYQTKGREEDTVIHVFRDGDYFGREREPFQELSRLLNVAISRARDRVYVILPQNPHPLVEPFVTLAGRK